MSTHQYGQLAVFAYFSHLPYANEALSWRTKMQDSPRLRTQKNMLPHRTLARCRVQVGGELA